MDGENRIYTSEMISENLKDFIYVPRKNGKTKVPCLLLKHIKSKKLMIYLHGNGEDLMMSRQQLDQIRIRLQINILAVEYPQYE